MLDSFNLNNMEELQQYVFHFNPFNKTWYAIPRDKYTDYWSDSNTKGVLKSSKIQTLIELISKGDTFIKKIK